MKLRTRRDEDMPLDEDMPTLATLPPELLYEIASRMPLTSLGRLGCTSRGFADTVRNAEEAWNALWAAATGCSARPQSVPARVATRCITSLEAAGWRPLPAPALPPPRQQPMNLVQARQRSQHGGIDGLNVAPRWREHACVLSCNGGRRLVVFGGRDAYVNHYFNDTWTCNHTGAWQRVANSGSAPSPRCFNSDAGGGRVVRSAGEQWALIFGGLCKPGHRDNQTWLLGPLDEPPERWAWLRVSQDEWIGYPPQARFHHTLTVVPGAEPGGAEDDQSSFVVLVGGHNRTIQPIFDMHVFTLRDSSFDWDDAEGDDSRRVAVRASWVAQPRDPQPPPRGFHSAAHWASPFWSSDIVIVCCGIGGSDGANAYYAPLGDAWAYDVCASEWIELPSLPEGAARSRAALAVCRHQLVLSGGCGDPASRADTAGGQGPLTPGIGFDDVWILSLLRTLSVHPTIEYSFTTLAGAAWERVVLPGVHRMAHINSSACALHGGAVLLILGGHDARCWPDQFGDLPGDSAWALHETEAIAIGKRATHPRTKLCSGGMPHYHSHEDDAVQARCEVFSAFYHKRVLVHGLRGQAHLNGAIGTLVGGRDMPVQAGPESRVGVALGPPHNTNVAVRRRNLQVSRCATLGETPVIVPPSVGDSDSAIWALTPALGRSGGEGQRLELGVELRNGIAVSRLSVLPGDAGPDEAGGGDAHAVLALDIV